MVRCENKGYILENGSLRAEVGEYGQLAALRLTDDATDAFRATNYVLNPEGSPAQGGDESEHHWFGELLLTLRDGETDTEYDTSTLERAFADDADGVTVGYALTNALSLKERYATDGDALTLTITLANAGVSPACVADLGVAMPYNEYWTPAFEGEELYDTRVTAHSFVGRDSSYIYATRPSGQGRMLLMTPDVGAGFEYRDCWRRANGRGESLWGADKGNWSCGLYVYYIYSAAVCRTGSGYLGSRSLTLGAGETRSFTLRFRSVADEAELKRALYGAGIVDAVALPGFAYPEDADARFYLHVNDEITIKSVRVACMHETELYKNLEHCVSNDLPCVNGEAHVDFVGEKRCDGERYLIYAPHLACLGVNHIEIEYEYRGESLRTTLQFYLMESVAGLLARRADFLVRTQTHSDGVGDTVFDDWMMDRKTVRANVVKDYWQLPYWGYGDDWGYTHGQYLAEYASHKPDARLLSAVDDYLETAVWRDLMGEHHDDFLVHDFLSEEPNKSPVYRGYAYPHIYNTFLAMYRAARLYPDAAAYKEDARTYLRRAYGVLRALYRSGQVAYNWETGLMGECSTPELITALEREGFAEEAADVREIMREKYDNFKGAKYPYGSEYFYDNTGEEAVYVLAAMNGNADMMRKIDLKTRACRGTQPVWYYYAVPTTGCGEAWWNFQYTAALAGIGMDENIRGNLPMSAQERATAQRLSYAAKLANLTCVNSGQIDADPDNIGAAAWTYQCVLGHAGGQGVGGGSLHNGWRQMTGEADLGLYGALRYLSSDVATDPVFGRYGYGCEIADADGGYDVTPRDGLSQRLNLIDEQIYVSLSGGEIHSARVRDDAVTLTVANAYGAPHTVLLEVSGGDYTVDGAPCGGSFTLTGTSEIVIRR